MTSLDRFYQIIRRPVITEKSSDDQATRNSYHFRVPVDANKVEVRQAIEKLFDVKVLQVNTLTVKGKERRRGYIRGQRSDWKKAMVTLSEGETIDVL